MGRLELEHNTVDLQNKPQLFLSLVLSYTPLGSVSVPCVVLYFVLCDSNKVASKCKHKAGITNTEGSERNTLQ